MTSSVALALGAGLTFSLSHFMVRLGLDASNPRTAVTINVTVNALGLCALAGLFAPIRPIWSLSAWPFVVAGLFAPSLARIFLYRGYRHMGLARSSVLVGATPLFSVITAILFLGERPSSLVLLGTLFIIIGIGTMSYTRTGGGTWTTWTIFLPLAAALCFGLRDIFTKLGLGLIPIPVSGAALTAATATLALYRLGRPAGRGLSAGVFRPEFGQCDLGVPAGQHSSPVFRGLELFVPSILRERDGEGGRRGRPGRGGRNGRSPGMKGQSILPRNGLDFPSMWVLILLCAARGFRESVQNRLALQTVI